jgi:hypothetical protein
MLITTITILVIGVLIFFVAGILIIQDKYEYNHLTEFQDGKWVYETDSTSGIVIKGNTYSFFSEDGIDDQMDVYKYEIRTELPQYADTDERPGDFLVLTNSRDTLYAEILGYGNGTFSLMTFPNMRTVVFKSLEEGYNIESNIISNELQGTFEFQISYAEWGDRLKGATCDVEIKGNDIVVKQNNSTNLTGGNIIAQGKLRKHIGTGKWIIASNEKDIYEDEIGGCTGIIVIDLENKTIELC